MEANYSQEEVDELIVRFLSGQADLPEQRRLEEWIAGSEAQRAYFLQLRDAWQVTRGAGNYDTQAAWDALQAQVSPVVIRGGQWKRYLYLAASYVLPFVIGGGVMWAWHHSGHAGDKPAMVTITSPKGATTRIELSDGTEVWLNAGSKLQYAQSYNTARREVKLEGEAFFKVHTDPHKPFTVKAADLRILALGTSFNVKAYPEDQTVVTTLVEGEVKIDGSQTPHPFNKMMKPHEHVVYEKPTTGNGNVSTKPAKTGAGSSTATAPVISSEVNNTEIYTAWKDGSWIVAAQTMSELAVTMERKFNVQVIIKDEELKDYKFSGTFRQETLEQILNILRLTAPLKYTISKGVVELTVDKELKEKYTTILKAAGK
ncbi:FecR family protein [Chitinophaga vietnamensis]|uniref:FecR family protein n=1 Tax=Chitinophaga vietnamensis TaxID=2593957 RepID=UPI0011776826|nr:FecR domain-containing protein [Chitinophaga vietnamensis]